MARQAKSGKQHGAENEVVPGWFVEAKEINSKVVEARTCQLARQTGLKTRASISCNQGAGSTRQETRANWVRRRAPTGRANWETCQPDSPECDICSEFQADHVFIGIGQI